MCSGSDASRGLISIIIEGGHGRVMIVLRRQIEIQESSSIR